jgi:hypothetical protein
MYFLVAWKGLRPVLYFFAACSFVIMAYPLLPGRMASFNELTPAQLAWYYFTGRLVWYGPAMALLATALLASWCIGHHTNRDYEAFLFTRPRSRGYFLWSEWSVGATQLVAGFILAIGAALAVLLVTQGPVWTHLQNAFTPTAVNPLDLENMQAVAYIASIHYWKLAASCIVGALTGYSLLVFLSILFRKKAPAVWLIIGLFVADFAADGRMRSLLPRVFFIYRPAMGSQVLPPTTLSLLVRVAVALLLTLAAQWVLERREV